MVADPALVESGFVGSSARWRRLREPVLSALAGSGSLLDVGCADGRLLASLVAWAAERGLLLEPYGVDASSRLIALARAAHPAWSGRFWIADATRWVPPRRFDAVRTELGYAQPGRERDLVEHLLRHAVAPGGRLVVCGYGRRSTPAAAPDDVAARLRSWGFAVGGEAVGADADGVVLTRVAWVADTG